MLLLTRGSVPLALMARLLLMFLRLLSRLLRLSVPPLLLLPRRLLVLLLPRG